VADLGAQIGELGSKLAVLEGSLDESDEALGIDRLLDEIIGAVLHRLHGVLDRSHSREEDDGSAGASIGELLEQTEPIEARKVEVGDDDGEALAIDEAKRILRRWRAADGEPFARQELDEGVTYIGFVVDEKDVTLLHVSPLALRARRRVSPQARGS